jgi:hypothetical protein
MRVGKGGLHFSCTCACWSVCRQGCTPSNTCIVSIGTYSVLCSKPDSTPWHDVECLLGTCKNCGLEKLFHLCPKELSASETVQWKQFRKEVMGVSEDGRERTHVKIEYKEGTPAELIVGLKRSLKFFIIHNFFAHWQNEEFKNQLLELQADTILSCGL